MANDHDPTTMTFYVLLVIIALVVVGFVVWKSVQPVGPGLTDASMANLKTICAQIQNDDPQST